MTESQAIGQGNQSHRRAVDLLERVMYDGAYADLLFRSLRERHPGAAWRKKVEATVRGVLERRLVLEPAINQFLSKGLHTLPQRVQVNFLVAAYRLLYAKDPAYAVVNEAVKTVDTRAQQWAKGVTNAVLRKLGQAGPQWLADVEAQLDPCARASVPPFWDRALTPVLPNADERAQAIAALRDPLPLSIVPTPAQSKVLDREGIAWRRFSAGPACLVETGGERFWSAFAGQGVLGSVRIQDAGIAAWIDAVASTLQTPVWDPFCAPGGKLRALLDTGIAVAGTDLNEARLGLVRQALEPGGTQPLELRVMDALLPDWPAGKQFGTIIADLPCTASGTLPRHPDVALRFDEHDLQRLNLEQQALLASLSRYVRPGGAIWYCTCSVFPQENEEVAEAFCANNPDWRLEPRPHPLGGEPVRAIRWWPHLHKCAGFCAQKLVFGGS